MSKITSSDNKITITELRKSIKNHLGNTCAAPRDLDYRIYQAKKHKDFKPEIVSKLKTQNPELVLSEGTKEARMLYNWCRQVGYDTHRIRMYTRLSVSKKGILYAKIAPEHNVEFDAIDFFIDRFPMFMIILESKRGVFYGSSKTGKSFMKTTIKEILPKFEERFSNNEVLSDLEDCPNDLWKEFYTAQYAGSRRNLKLFYKNMPKKCQDGYEMEIEKHVFDGNKSLLEY